MERHHIVRLADKIALEVFRNYLILRDGVPFELADIELSIEAPDLGISDTFTPLGDECLKRGVMRQGYRSGIRLCYGDEKQNLRCSIGIYGIMNDEESLYSVREIEYEGWTRRRDLKFVQRYDFERVERIVESIDEPGMIHRKILLRLSRARLPQGGLEYYLPQNPKEFCRLYSSPLRYLRLPSLERLKEPSGPSDARRVICSLFGEKEQTHG